MSKFSGKVRKAVFPVAGLGTRFLPATKASPKEMLPVVDKPLIQYAVEEAAAAGITDMIFITGRSKRAIEDHFDKAYELEAELEAKNKQQLLEVVRGVAPGSINCIYIRQPEALGLGHAVLCAEPVVGDEPFAILLADDLMDAGAGGVPVMRQMVEQFEQHHSSVIAVEEVPLKETSKYGIVSTAAAGGVGTVAPAPRASRRSCEQPSAGSADGRAGGQAGRRSGRSEVGAAGRTPRRTEEVESPAGEPCRLPPHDVGPCHQGFSRASPAEYRPRPR